MTEKTNDENRLDQLLDSLPGSAPASDAFLERLLAIPATELALIPERGKPKRSKNGDSWLNALVLRGLGLRPSQLLPQAIGLAAAGSLGIMLGMSSIARHETPIEVFDTTAYMLGDPGLARDLEDVD